MDFSHRPGIGIALSAALTLAGCGDDGETMMSMDSGGDTSDDTGAIDTGADTAATDTSADTGALDGGDASLTSPTVQVDFFDARGTPDGNWNVVGLAPLSGQALIDFDTGEVTTVLLSSSGFSTAGGEPENWPMGDVDWVVASAAEDLMLSALGGDGRVEISGLVGAQRVEVVVAEGFGVGSQQVMVNDDPTTTTFRGATVDTTSWNPTTDGADPGDWPVWESVAPVDGVIVVSVGSAGRINALRVSPAP